MPEQHYPGSTIGIIGGSVASALLAQAAGKLGYRVASLVLDEHNPVRQFSSWQTVTESYDEAVLRYFAGRIDTVIVEMDVLSHQGYQILAELTDVVLSEDLTALTTDRLIEKAYLDSKRCLVAPFSMVTNLEDIKEAVEYIGFPCYLKSTQRHLPNANEHVILYSEEDYSAAVEKMEQGTCILEAWIPVEKKVTLTIVRNNRGEMLVYPICETVQRGEQLGEQVHYPAGIGLEAEREIIRTGQYLAQELNVIGGLTVEYLVTSAGLMYINKASVGLSNVAIFSLGAMSLSHFEAVVRATVGLPLPAIHPLSQAAVALPVSGLNKENVVVQMMMRTDWVFTLFNPLGNEMDDLMGHVIITGDSLESCERQIELAKLTQLSAT